MIVNFLSIFINLPISVQGRLTFAVPYARTMNHPKPPSGALRLSLLSQFSNFDVILMKFFLFRITFKFFFLLLCQSSIFFLLITRHMFNLGLLLIHIEHNGIVFMNEPDDCDFDYCATFNYAALIYVAQPKNENLSK